MTDVEQVIAAEDRKELGLRVTIIPSISAEEEARLTRRNYRRTVLDKARIFGVSGITNAEFLRKSVTDQFLILRQFIPDGWRPAAIEPWFDDVKVDETVLGEALQDTTT